MVCSCCGEDDDVETAKRMAKEEKGSLLEKPLEEPLVSSRDDGIDEAVTDTGTEFTYNQLLLKAGSGSPSSVSTVMPSWAVFETVSNCYNCEAEFEPLGMMSVVDDVFSSVSGKMSKLFSPTGSSSRDGSKSTQQRRSSSPADDGHGRPRKRHHCRRCRNCFCEACAGRREIILLLLEDGATSVEYEVTEGKGGRKEMKAQRVCDRCYEELKLENKYFEGRSFLCEGQGFKKTELMGMRSKLVTLKVSGDYNTLSLRAGLEIQKSLLPSRFAAEDEETDDKDHRHVPLGSIDKVELKGLTSFDIIWRDGSSPSSSVHTWAFEGDTHQTASTWAWFLAEACRRSRTPSLKIAVELERRQREEKDRRMDKERQRQEDITAKRRERMKAREGVSRKYSRSMSRGQSAKENNHNDM